MGSALGDPGFAHQAQNLTNEMLRPSQAQHIQGKINDSSTHDPAYYFESQGSLLETYGTSHVSVIDNDNNMVSVTR